MTIFNLQLNLPDKTIQEAKQYGLLESQTIEKLIQIELQRCHTNKLLKIDTCKTTETQPIKRSLSSFIGTLKSSATFAADPVAIQRAMRDEWD